MQHQVAFALCSWSVISRSKHPVLRVHGLIDTLRQNRSPNRNAFRLWLLALGPALCALYEPSARRLFLIVEDGRVSC